MDARSLPGPGLTTAPVGFPCRADINAPDPMARQVLPQMQDQVMIRTVPAAQNADHRPCRG
ncbi:hypothetical protein ADL35_14680 [Streptomyces sp. NRRL WC-3753]|nr:hypothetical protein ADL35_14680 [Streptomyces sp. NRRL WC-3753]